MARPVVAIAAFLTGGIIFGRYFSLQEHIWLFIPVVCLLAIIYFFVYKRKIALILPAFAVIGAFLFVSALSPKDSVLEEIALREGFVHIEGQVQDISLTRSGRQRVQINTSSFRIAPSLVTHHARVGIIAILPENIHMSLGQHITISGYLQTLDTARNPGGFDEFQFLRSRGIEYRVFAETAQGYDIELSLIHHIRNFGVRLASVFDEVLPEDMAGIMKAMIVGDRSGLDHETRNMYKDLGMFHILVVSGLHLSILIIFIERTLKFFGVGVKKRSLITLVFIILFAVLTGAGVATVRASIMGILLIVSGIAGFENDTPTSISLAAVILLLYQPLFLFDIGFIYSFSAVAALVFITPPMEKVLNILSERHAKMRPFLNNWYSKKYLAGTLAANLAYFPINAYFFYEFSPLSPPVNFILLPSVFFIIVLGFIVALVGAFGGLGLLLAAILSFPIWILLTIYHFVMQMALKIPFAVVLTGRPSYAAMTVMLAAIVLFIVIVNYGKNIGKRLGALTVFSVAAFSTIYFASLANNNIDITFLDVGQGKSAVVSRNGSAVIIDGGGVFGREAGENVGTFTLIPYLNYRGIRQATAVITHNHRDHAFGIAEAVLEGRIKHIIMAHANIMPGYYMYDMMLYAANITNTPISYISSGDTIDFYNMRMHVLFPYAERIFQGENNSSIVLRLVHGSNAILLTADIETPAEAYLLSRGDDISAHILQVAHHGSHTSSTGAFLDAVAPQAAVISAGRNNMFGHPHASVINRLTENEIVYYQTPQHGAVLVRSNGRSLFIRTMLGAGG